MGFSICLITFAFYCVKEEMMKMVDENGGDTGMIRFGFGIAQRQGRCAYFTLLTFRSRLQELDWRALLGLCQRKTASML